MDWIAAINKNSSVEAGNTFPWSEDHLSWLGPGRLVVERKDAMSENLFAVREGIKA